MAVSEKFRQATLADQQGDLQQAESLYRQLISEAPGLIEPPNNLAALLVNSGRFDEAITILQGLARRYPDKYEIMANLGLALKGAQRLPEAIECFTRALNLADPSKDVRTYFHSAAYLRHNARRLEHLASLRIPVSGKTVLEVGAGIGDHTHYYLDRGCSILATEARPENLRLLCQLMPTVQVALLDMDNPRLEPHRTFDVVHCYGLLYHLHNPERALEFLGACCQGMMFLETCVSFGSQSAVNLTGEKADHPTQAASGMGCRPTRPWILQKLRQLFPHVYLPRTQPNHKDFPVDWTAPERHLSPLSRAVFIASRAPIENDMLLTELPDRQERHP